jgi:nitrogen fixation NifU-like protein
MQYSEKVMDHFMNPRNVGKVDNPSGVGEVGNPTCGDIMHIEIDVKDEIIQDIKFRTFGCAAAIATSSMATEMVKGKTLEEAERITNRTVAEALDGLPPVKMHCSNLAADALHEAIKSYRQGGGSSATVTKGCCQNEADSSCEKGMEIKLP